MSERENPGTGPPGHSDRRPQRRFAAGGRLAARRAAERLIERHGDALLSTARRYTPSPEDAEDAYQRGLEIMLTKAPAVSEQELLPWVKTVIKHEAFAIWRGRDRAATPSEETPLEQAASGAPSPDEQVESLERLRMGAEAIRRLKPQELRCLLLRAEGYSYRQICQVTGWTYTKVNRCLTEGRRSFLKGVAGIESGAECERLSPLLSALADGEASAADMAALRPHLRSCLACRAALRAYREIPHRAAEVVPVAGGAGLEEGPAGLLRWLDSAIAWAQERVMLLGAKAQAAAETTTAGKVAAVAASTAALAGGTVAIRAIDGGVARGDPAAPPEASQGVVERSTPAGLLPRSGRGRLGGPGPVAVRSTESVDVPEVDLSSAPTPRLALPEPPPPPAAAPAPAAPAPEAGPSPTQTAPPPSLPESAAVPVSDASNESALADVDEEERRIEPMTTPIARAPAEPGPSPPSAELE